MDRARDLVKQRVIFHSQTHSPIAIITRVGQIKNRSQEPYPCLPHGYWEPSTWTIFHWFPRCIPRS